MRNKKGQTTLQVILNGGVPLLLVVAGIFFIYNAITYFKDYSRWEYQVRIIFGLLFSVGGSLLFYKTHTS